ncbi:MAG TPA: GntR family transcriptional regulator [Acetivibrio clariflavus]|nr:GntR family transcriptional regulator [Acetivibrio clariflavus]
MINKYSNEPLYSQLKNIIIEKIEKGEYPSGSKIPSEQELCELYDISRPTVRQAISELTSSGYLYKEKGKGTFVSNPKTVVNAKSYTGFTDSILDNDMTGERKIISAETLTNRELRLLDDVFSIGNNQVIDFACFNYTGKINDDLISLNTSYIPINLFPNIIEDVKNQKPSFDILRGKYPLLPTRTKSTLEVIYTEQFEAQYLMVPPGQALIKISNIIYSKSGQVVEFVISKYRADRCKLLFENSK